MPEETENCPFCTPDRIEPQVIAETAGFYLVADLHPLREGHVLLVAREHLSCLAALPSAREGEFVALKDRVADFLARAYGPATFFEHGIAGQTIPHAHLHALPAAPSILSAISQGREVRRIAQWSDVREWYAARGPYLYYEEAGWAVLLSPGHVAPAYLQSTVGAAQRRAGASPARPDGATAAQDLRDRWRRYCAASGDEEIEVVTCFLWRDGRICLFKRSQLVGSARGKWHAVSGYLPRGVDPLAHAFTEVREETGLDSSQLTLLRAGASRTLADPRRPSRWRIHPFLFRVLDGEPRLNWEHVDQAWIDPRAIWTYDCVSWLADLYDDLSAELP